MRIRRRRLILTEPPRAARAERLEILRAAIAVEKRRQDKRKPGPKR